VRTSVWADSPCWVRNVWTITVGSCDLYEWEFAESAIAKKNLVLTSSILVSKLKFWRMGAWWPAEWVSLQPLAVLTANQNSYFTLQSVIQVNLLGYSLLCLNSPEHHQAPCTLAQNKYSLANQDQHYQWHLTHAEEDNIVLMLLSILSETHYFYQKKLGKLLYS
jgi:hypothetical protein